MATAGEVNGSAKTGISGRIPAKSNPTVELPSEIAANINYHAQNNPHFSPFKFEPEQAFYATAESVRDSLIRQWNETYSHFHQVDPKKTYYLSMEYLLGRALTNAIGNLDIQDGYADALKKLGHGLEEIVEQICAVLYPGDATESGKLLRLKQQFFLCSASLQDIIFRFEERKEGERQCSEFPNKVVVQLKDTHPTLASLELMRLLMDDEGLGCDEAWNIITRTIAYTNHTVLPEAPEKWSQPVMWKLLPRLMEIIEEIDKRLIKFIRSERADLQNKLSQIRFSPFFCNKISL